MNKKQIASTGIATLAVAGIVAFAVSFTMTTGSAKPEPTATTIAVNPAALTNWQNDLSTAAKTAEARRIAEAARVEADRVAAEAAAAESARVEAERIAAEQAAAKAQQQSEQQTYEAPQQESDPWASKMRVPWVADPNPENAMGGYWDTSQCPTQSGSTGPDGNQYCD